MILRNQLVDKAVSKRYSNVLAAEFLFKLYVFEKDYSYVEAHLLDVMVSLSVLIQYFETVSTEIHSKWLNILWHFQTLEEGKSPKGWNENVEKLVQLVKQYYKLQEVQSYILAWDKQFEGYHYIEKTLFRAQLRNWVDIA